jgi:hypothetical protein
MYWYPFSEEEEEKAWKQAEAQSEADETDGARKCVGNLGEIVVQQFLSEYGEQWSYLNQEALDNQEPEYEDFDFRVGRSGTKVDIKTTSDIRKFDPVAMYYEETQEADRGHPGYRVKEDYPKVDVSEADIFVFVLISHARDTEPGSGVYGPESVDEEWEELPQISKNLLEGRSGNRVATILGWLYSKEFQGEVISNMNRGAHGKFTRMAFRDMYEMLMRTDDLPH